jgi:3-oxoacyl-[acyl-carrier-protein] synthase-3
MSKSKIKNIESYFPKNILTNDMISEEFPSWSSKNIESKLGIKSRYIVDQNETALDLAYHAASKVLRKYDRSKIDFLILCTQSPDYFLPTSACILQTKLNLGKNVGAFDFNLGCSGYIYGLGLAKSLLSSNMAKSILLVMSDTYSKHINKLDFANRSIFGDGATASIIESNEIDHLYEFVFGTDGSGFNNLIIPNGGVKNRYEDNPKLIELKNGNMNTNNDLYMNGPEIFNFTIEIIPKLIDDVLEKNKKNIEEIDYFIFHQANSFMLNYLRKKLRIPKDKFYNNILETGNTVSSTIPIALKDCMENEIVQSGDLVMLCGFGVGYSWGATIIKI